MNFFGYAVPQVAYVRSFAGDLGWRWLRAPAGVLTAGPGIGSLRAEGPMAL
jgi:hypothetical protein